MFGAEGARGMNIEASINPQKIKNRFSILSAKKPKIGCIILEQIWVIAIIIVAMAIEKFNLAAINGISGLRNPP